MFTIKKFDIGSVALYSFVMILILCVITIIPIGFIFMAIHGFMPDPAMAPNNIDTFYPFWGIGLFIIIPLAYAVFGTILNVILAFVYNVISTKLGGIKIALEQVEEIPRVQNDN